MRITNKQVWDVTSNGEMNLALCGNKEGDKAISSLYINPLSNCTVVVKGYVSEDDSVGVTLKCVDIANLSKKDSVTTAGNYLYIVEPYYKLNIAVTGTSKIIIKALA